MVIICLGGKPIDGYHEWRMLLWGQAFCCQVQCSAPTLILLPRSISTTFGLLVGIATTHSLAPQSFVSINVEANIELMGRALEPHQFMVEIN
jgi:hypothetical protein